MSTNKPEYVAYVKNGDSNIIVRWEKEDNIFTLEDSNTFNFVMIYKDSINDLLSEISKLKELMDEDKEKRRPKKC